MMSVEQKKKKTHFMVITNLLQVLQRLRKIELRSFLITLNHCYC